VYLAHYINYRGSQKGYDKLVEELDNEITLVNEGFYDLIKAIELKSDQPNKVEKLREK